MSDRVLVMDAGRVQQEGSPTEVYHRPANTFVAQFIGESNLFEARVATVDGKEARFETAEGLVLTGAAQDLSAGETVFVLLRPETFDLLADGAGAGPRCDALTVRLEQEIFLGTDYHLIARTVPGDLRLKVTVRDSHREALSGIAPGSLVRLQYPRHRLRALRD